MAILAEFTLPVKLRAFIAELQALDLLLRKVAEDTDGIASLEPSLKKCAEYAPVTTCKRKTRHGKKDAGMAW